MDSFAGIHFRATTAGRSDIDPDSDSRTSLGDPNAHSHPNAHIDSYTDGNVIADTYTHADSLRHAYSDANADTHLHADGDCDDDAEPHVDAFCDSILHSHWRANSVEKRDAFAVQDCESDHG